MPGSQSPDPYLFLKNTVVDKSPALLKLTGLNKAALTTQISDHTRAIKKGRAGTKDGRYWDRLFSSRRSEATRLGRGWKKHYLGTNLSPLWGPYLVLERNRSHSEPPATPGTPPAFTPSPPQWPRTEQWKETPVWSQGDYTGYWPLNDSWEKG